ncbi:MAG: hypothetical protein L3J39_17035 [Verrucomicrobiales bacterium]|nr:hypothetical protein [Verrucomicrobiales bacterium]
MSTLTDSDIRKLPTPIVDKLRSLIRRVRRLIFLRGLFATIAAGLISILLIMAIDASFTLFSDAARWALSLCGLAFTTAIAWHFLIQPLSRKITLTHIARILETRHPDLQERISSAVELMRSDDPDSIRGSQELIDELVNSAVIDVKDVSPESEFDNKKTQRFFYAAATVAAFLLILLLIWPRQTGVLFARAIAPFLDIGNAYSNTLTVDPGDISIPIGESVTVQMSIKNKHIRRVTLRRSSEETGKESVESMQLLESQADGTQTFTITFPAVAESFRYRINAGNAVSRYYQVDAVPLPEVEKLTLRYQYPPYTGLDPLEVESKNGDISAVEHTQVTVTAQLNKVITTATLSINDKILASEATINPIKPQVSWSFPLKPDTTGNWILLLKDRNDFENIPSTYAIHAVPDRAPEINITAPQIRELKLKRSETLPIEYTLKEDFGFSSLDLIVRRDGESKPLIITQPLPGSSTSALGHWNGKTALDISSLELTDQTRKLSVQIRVRDNLPPEYQGPHETLSEVITVHLDNNAQSLVQQKITADRRELEQALSKANNDLRQARSEVAQAEAQLKRSETLSPEATRELDQFREKAKSAHETLRDISEKMKQTAFDRQAQQIEKLNKEQIAKAREAANQIPLSDQKQQRIEKAQEAKKEIESALNEIAQISKSLKESQPEVQMIAKLNDLAGNQRQLAKTAEQSAKRAASEASDPQKQPTPQEQKKRAQDFAKWQQQQKQLQNQLGDILKENEAALKDVLKQQQQKAQQLADQARQLSKEQADIQKATQHASKDNAQDALRKQLLSNLAKEQDAIAKDTQKLDLTLKQQKAETKDKANPENPDTPDSKQADAQTPSLDLAVNSTSEAAKALEKEQLKEAMDAAQKASQDLQSAQDAATPPDAESKQAAQAAAKDTKADAEKTAAANKAAAAKGEPSPSDNKKSSPSDKQQEKMADKSDGAKKSAKPSSPTAQKIAELKQRQQSVQKQIQSIQSGELEEALTMQEEQLAQQAEQLSEQADSLENDTQMAKQATAKSRAAQAESLLKSAKSQADRASQQLTQAKQAQERAEQSQRQQQKNPAKTPLSPQSKQALAQSQSSQKNAENAFKAAAAQLEQAAKSLQQQADKLSSDKMKSQALQSKDLAQSYQDVAQASDAKSEQQASDKAQKAADTLQQLAQAALEKLAGQQQAQASEQDGSQQSDPRESESESKPQLSDGGKTPDMDGSGVPPELAKLGITFSDWARMKGTLQAGSSNQNGETTPEEYRDLVQRYFRAIANQASKK